MRHVVGGMDIRSKLEHHYIGRDMLDNGNDDLVEQPFQMGIVRKRRQRQVDGRAASGTVANFFRFAGAGEKKIAPFVD